MLVTLGWWPGLANAAKHPKIVARVTYRVTMARRGECAVGTVGGLALGGERVVGRVPLADSQAGYQQVGGTLQLSPLTAVDKVRSD